MHRFMQRVNDEYGQNFTEYEDLWRWSVDNIPEFWATFWDFADILHSKPYDQDAGRQVVRGG